MSEQEHDRKKYWSKAERIMGMEYNPIAWLIVIVLLVFFFLLDLGIIKIPDRIWQILKIVLVIFIVACVLVAGWMYLKWRKGRTYFDKTYG